MPIMTPFMAAKIVGNKNKIEKLIQPWNWQDMRASIWVYLWTCSLMKILSLQKKNSRGGGVSSGATSVAEHRWDDAVVKAAARPEMFEDPGPGDKMISL